MKSDVLFATDLDATMIYSARAATPVKPPAQLRPPSPQPELGQPMVTVEWKEGAPVSSMTPRALRLLADLVPRCTVVPTTTRNLAQYGRISGLPAVTWAITSNGGHVLHHGAKDRDWERHVAGRAGDAAPLPEAAEVIRDVRDRLGVHHPVREPDHLFVVLVVDPSDVDQALLAEVAAALEPLGWVSSFQGRKLYAVPAWLDKRHAVAHVVERTGAQLVVAAGDSLLDGPMLQAADIAWRPAHGELHRAGFAAAHVTRQSGAAAAEEVLAAVHAVCDKRQAAIA